MRCNFATPQRRRDDVGDAAMASTHPVGTLQKLLLLGQEQEGRTGWATPILGSPRNAALQLGVIPL
jgi:hypothetical protein